MAFSHEKSRKSHKKQTFPWLFMTESRFFQLYLTFFFTEGDWYGIFILLRYYLLTGLPQNASLTVLYINTAIGLEGGVNECMLLVGALSIVCRGVQVAFEPFLDCFMLMPRTELVLCLRPNSMTGTNFCHIFVSVDKTWDYAIFTAQGGCLCL